MNRQKRFVYGGLAAIIALGLVFGGYNAGKSQKEPTKLTNSQIADNYPLLARRVFSDNPKDPLINFTALRADFQKYFTDNGLKGSLYFEYLHTGTEVRVSGDEKQAAASLLKVPLAMEMYKAKELGKLNPKQTVTLKQEWLDSAFGELYKKGAGYSLTLEEAAKIMLTDSDNTALKAVADSVNGLLPPEDSVFTYLDASFTQGQDLSVAIGARAYSSILKCLYFACYINTDDSQLLLDYLTETPFNDRMMAGIDNKTLKVAHKIGVFQEDTQSDCGIVYLKDRPYIFCAMIEGPNTPETNQHIANLSQKAYRYVVNQ